MKPPKHYSKGIIQPIDFIADQGLNFDMGCAVKYICRAGEKPGESKEEDLQKAIDYLQHEIDKGKESADREVSEKRICNKCKHFLRENEFCKFGLSLIGDCTICVNFQSIDTGE